MRGAGCPEWNIGIVTEIDRDEAYETLTLVRRAFRAWPFGLLLVAAVIALASRHIYGLQKEVQKAERLGQYTLEEKIGEGGMGAVYRARHAFLRRPTAVKLIRAEHASPETLARFEREVQLTSQLTHPNTIAIYDYGRTPEGIFYYAMEYLPGLPARPRDRRRRAAAGAPRRPHPQADLRLARRGASRSGSSTATSSPPTSCSASAAARTTS